MVHDGVTFSKAAAYNETVTGIIGLAPPKTQMAKDRHFLYQLKENGVIEKLVFAISMNSDNGFENSKIEIGNYNP